LMEDPKFVATQLKPTKKIGRRKWMFNDQIELRKDFLCL
jgi:hypothetical protein